MSREARGRAVATLDAPVGGRGMPVTRAAVVALALAGCSFVEVRPTPSSTNECSSSGPVIGDTIASVLALGVVAWAASTWRTDCVGSCNDKQDQSGVAALLVLAVTGPSAVYGAIALPVCRSRRHRLEPATLDVLATLTSCQDIAPIARTVYLQDMRAFEQRFADDTRLARCVPVLTKERIASLRSWAAAYAGKGSCEEARGLRTRAFALQRAIGQDPDLPDSDLGECVLH